jgi:hypothetical protein
VDATLGLVEQKIRILSGLIRLLQARRSRLDHARDRGDERAVALNIRRLAAEERELIRLEALDDWDFWFHSRDMAPDVFFLDLAT